VFRLLLRIRSRPYHEIGIPVTIVIAPHQDDEVLGCGGLIARKSLEGRQVHVIYLTDGGGSHLGHPTLTSERLISLREEEARQAMAELGLDPSAIHFMGARDGSLGMLPTDEFKALAVRLQASLDRIVPDELFTPCRDDGSSEHEAAYALVQAALLCSGRPTRLFEYPVWSWWNPLLLWRPLFTCPRVVRHRVGDCTCRKAAALACYRSQIEPTLPWTKPLLSATFISLFKGPDEFFFEG
jgi:LmbE family N-acetylglucosaminyl deacetylase